MNIPTYALGQIVSLLNSDGGATSYKVVHNYLVEERPLMVLLPFDGDYSVTQDVAEFNARCVAGTAWVGGDAVVPDATTVPRAA